MRTVRTIAAFAAAALVAGVLLGADPAGAGTAPAPSRCQAQNSTAQNAADVVIPDGGTVSSTVTVTNAQPYLYYLVVRTSITHANSGDLDLTVTSPEGTVVTLTTDNGGSNDDVFTNSLRWVDDADDDGTLPYTTNDNLATDHAYVNGVSASTLAPEEALSSLDGEDPNGVWTLTASDAAGNGGGTILDWSVDLSAIDRAPLTQSLTRTGSGFAISSGAPSVNSSLINFPTMPGGYIHRVTVRTDLTHDFNGDIDMTLTAPYGRTVTLTTDNAGTAEDVFDGTLWSDRADPDGALPYTSNPGLVTDEPYVDGVAESTLVPEEGLGSLSTGTDPAGNWQLTISDDSNDDGGALAGWALTVTTAGCSRPDARIRVGTGAIAGNDTYNATGQGQSRTGSAARGGSVTFRIPVQNDASVRERIRLSGGGSGPGFGVVYRTPDGRNITAAVRAGTYRTPRLAPGASYVVRAVVTVKATAPAGARLTRKLTASSPTNGAVRDTVSFTARRA